MPMEAVMRMRRVPALALTCCLSLLLLSCGDGGGGVVEPTARSFSLLITKAGSGTGTVTSSPAGIDCGNVCAADFSEGTVVTLTAGAPTGSAFIAWSGACSGREPCQVTMSRAQAVTAEFVPGPVVLFAVPQDGASDVEPLFDRIEFHFSEPMGSCGMTSSGWYPYDWGYSADRTVISLTRQSAGVPLYGWRVLVRPMRDHCWSAAGEPLKADFQITFTTAYRIPPVRVAANPDRGFHWPYYLVPPSEVASPGTLLVEPNNTGTWSDDLQVHEDAAKTLMGYRIPFAEDMGSPLLIPVFPRPRNPQAPEPGGIYVHALDRYSLSGTHPGLERIDLQMVAMIDDALERLEAMGHSMDRRVFMMGFSASGAFTSRFSLIHPGRIKAAAAGSPGGWPLAPLTEWQGTPLKYAMGVLDLEDLVGRPFDLETFRSVPLYIYVGDQDTNDAFDVRGMTAAEKNQIYDLLNWPADPILAHRWPLAEAMYGSVGASAQFVIYPGVAHSITAGMFEDLKAFFRAHR
jgi:dienelactone hydrolase